MSMLADLVKDDFVPKLLSLLAIAHTFFLHVVKKCSRFSILGFRFRCLGFATVGFLGTYRLIELMASFW
jgi:hypothetical protein